ncbi:ras-related protein Rab-23-like [Sycon ciliatum]|uniref:ras-related protein Rab-23-like n=1 Tax=Sycon ciliatum TaxID=27933 RepID=UPI0020AC432C
MAGMMEEELETEIKVVVVGNGNVGKSSMIQRYCKNIFTKDYKKTIGVDFLERQLSVEGEDVRLMLWDTAGQEEFDAITKSYYRGAQVCVLAFSTIDRDSFEAVEKWKAKVEDEVGSIIMVLVQNKIDLIDEAKVRTDEAEELAKKLQLRFFRTSVKESYNVNEVFLYLTKRHLQERDRDFVPAPQQRIGQPTDARAENGSSGTNSAGNNTAAGGGSRPGGFQIKPTKPTKQRTGGKKSKMDFCAL